jgi:hypothetical protein
MLESQGFMNQCMLALKSLAKLYEVRIGGDTGILRTTRLLGFMKFSSVQHYYSV